MTKEKQRGNEPWEEEFFTRKCGFLSGGLSDE
jgi:hypothetical protein